MKIQTTIPSPCIQNCSLNNDDICMGCFRTIDEITDWGQTTDHQRRTILLKAEERRNREQKIKSADIPGLQQ